MFPPVWSFFAPIIENNLFRAELTPAKNQCGRGQESQDHETICQVTHKFVGTWDQICRRRRRFDGSQRKRTQKETTTTIIDPIPTQLRWSVSENVFVTMNFTVEMGEPEVEEGSRKVLGFGKLHG